MLRDIAKVKQIEPRRVRISWSQFESRRLVVGKVKLSQVELSWVRWNYWPWLYTWLSDSLPLHSLLYVPDCTLLYWNIFDSTTALPKSVTSYLTLYHESFLTLTWWVYLVVAPSWPFLVLVDYLILFHSTMALHGSTKCVSLIAGMEYEMDGECTQNS